VENQKIMKKFFIIVLSLASIFSFSQDTIDDKKIKPVWVEPEVVFEQPKEVEEELVLSDVESIQKDLQFLEELPKSYDEVPKEDLKNVLKGIDDKIKKLIQERDSLLNCKVINQKLVDTKNGTIKTLEKEKNIVGLTIESGDLKYKNGNLVGQNDELKIQKDQLKKYLYISFGALSVLSLIVAVVIQRKKIHVQDEEIERQLDDINKKNTYLEHAAKILRHDMHSGINTYMPRGISSLERRLTPEIIKDLKIESPLKMIKEGLQHTQKVYKGVYEFTNLVKKDAELNKETHNLTQILTDYLSNTSYTSQVAIDQLPTIDVNQALFCTAIDNLVRNGLKYNDSETKVVAISMEDEEHIVVQDNGRGMTQADFDHLSQPYTRKEGQKETGTGLGLNICVAILNEHGFKVTCEKNEVGTKIKIKIK
jgi:signal transduction histidine kinase